MDAGQLAYMVYASCPETIDFVVPCKWLVLTEADVNGSLFIAEVACRTGDAVLLADEMPVAVPRAERSSAFQRAVRG